MILVVIVVLQLWLAWQQIYISTGMDRRLTDTPGQKRCFCIFIATMHIAIYLVKSEREVNAILATFYVCV